MTNINSIDILQDEDCRLGILPEMFNFYAQAAMICFLENGYEHNVIMGVTGSFTSHFSFTWKEIEPQIRDYHNDLVYAAEHGGYYIAFVLINKLTDYKVIKQAKRRTGFDYWLGHKEDMMYPFTSMARLEVSGLLKGTNAQISQRLNQKLKQTKKSDDLNLPALIIVTEFSTPLSNIAIK